MSRVRCLLLATLLVLTAMILLAGCRSAHTTSAILYIDEQRYDKAVAVLQEGFQYQDDEADAYYYLGEAYSHMGEDAVEEDEYAQALDNYSKAYDAYTRALELGFDEEEVVSSLKYNYNNRLRQAKRDWDDKYYEQAEGHLRLAYAALPDSVTPVKSIARMKMQMSNEGEYVERKNELLGEALVLLDQVLADNPEAYELLLDKANVLAALERNDEAGAIYEQLLAEHGDDTVLLTEIANLATNEGDYAKAADFYVRIVDLNEGDTDATNDNQNKDMLVAAGTWYSLPTIARYDDAIANLDRAANLELIPTENLMLQRVRTYYQYGKDLRGRAAAEADPAAKADMEARALALLNRSVEIGVAMTTTYVANAEGFLYLSSAQFELGDFAAAEKNLKTYEELSAARTQ
jgi:tetratricopeptide (TPR) repeat protein